MWDPRSVVLNQRVLLLLLLFSVLPLEKAPTPCEARSTEEPCLTALVCSPPGSSLESFSRLRASHGSDTCPRNLVLSVLQFHMPPLVHPRSVRSINVVYFFLFISGKHSIVQMCHNLIFHFLLYEHWCISRFYILRITLACFHFF